MISEEESPIGQSSGLSGAEATGPPETIDSPSEVTDGALPQAPEGGGPPVPPVPEGKPLSPGLALTVDDAQAMAGELGVRIVMPLGPVKVGKTTMAVEIYANYLRRTTWAEASFCRSQSLLDYEMLAFPSRLSAGVDLPETWRTRLRETRYLLHLQLRRNDAARVNLLFANQSGELSEHIRDGQDPATELPLLSRAERVLICVDGALVADPALAGRAVSDTRQLIGTLAERATLASNAEAALVLTKLDLVTADPEGLGRWAEAEEDLKERLKPLGRGERTFRVAARSAKNLKANQFEELTGWLLADSASPSLETSDPDPAQRSIGHQEPNP